MLFKEKDRPEVEWMAKYIDAYHSKYEAAGPGQVRQFIHGKRKTA